MDLNLALNLDSSRRRGCARRAIIIRGRLERADARLATDRPASDPPAPLGGFFVALEKERPNASGDDHQGPAGAGSWQDYVVPQCWEAFTDDDHAVWDLLFARQVELLGIARRLRRSSTESTC